MNAPPTVIMVICLGFVLDLTTDVWVVCECIWSKWRLHGKNGVSWLWKLDLMPRFGEQRRHAFGDIPMFTILALKRGYDCDHSVPSTRFRRQWAFD
jgi:hypothetical protein